MFDMYKKIFRFDNKNRHEVNCTGEQLPNGSGLNRKTAPVPPTINKPSSRVSLTFLMHRQHFPTVMLRGNLSTKKTLQKKVILTYSMPPLPSMPRYLERYRGKRRAFKFYMSLHVNFEKAALGDRLF